MHRLFVFCLLLLLHPSLCFATRGISLDIKKSDGGTESISLYKESHALLVGVSDYINGWPDLNSVPGEVKELEVALTGQGFKITKVINPDKDQLADAFEDFINRYGYDKENRLLFFFSGHGYSRTDAGKGYIVPTDAPSPLNDLRGFMSKAIEMEQIVTWARRIESKHAMFLFDSCFSGTVFQSRALPKEPPHISAMVARPVRQFISAGSAGEEVPSRSVFVPSFIRAIEGEGDLDKDGYVTGTELGMYLNRKVAGYQLGQTPQYGKIRDPRLDQGDFVMVAGLTTYTDVSTPVTFQKGTLAINSDPYGASIYAEGIHKGTAPLTLDNLSDGRIKVRAEKSGYQAKEEYVLIRTGRKVELNFNLDKIVTTGSIEVSSTPSGAKWYLDEAYVGTTPDVMRDLDSGTYQVHIKKDDYQEFRTSAKVRAGQSANVHAAMRKIVTKEPTLSKNSSSNGAHDFESGSSKYDVAVIIGNRSYSGRVPVVEYAHRDAQAIRQHLETKMNFRAENIIQVLDASLTDFVSTFGSKSNYRGKLFNFIAPGKSRVFIYYVGAGAPGLDTRDAYFLPVGAEPQNLKNSGYSVQTFYDNIGKLPAKELIIVLDTSFSGDTDKGFIHTNISPALLTSPRKLVVPDHALSFASGEDGQRATSFPEKQHSMFTYYFLKGLQGEADADKNKKITVSEMKSFLNNNVSYWALRQKNIRQNPQVKGDPEKVLVTLE